MQVRGPALPRFNLAQCDGGSLVFPAGAPTTLVGALHAAAAAPIPNEVVYVQSDGTEIRQNHADLLELARRVCGGLQARGLRPGEQALLHMEAGPEFVVGFWGCVLAGVVPVPLAAATDPRDAALHRLCNARQLLGRPKVLTDDRQAPILRAWFQDDESFTSDIVAIDGTFGASAPGRVYEPTPDATAILLLTSGTSGLPKAVPLSHRNVLACAFGAAQLNDFTSADVSLNWMPLDHVGGLVMFHVRDIVLRCRHIHVPTELILHSPLRWLDLVHHYRATLTWAPNFAFALVNAQAAAMAGRNWNLTCLRFILNGGEAIAGATARRFLELLAPFGLPETAMHPAWGMSETASGVTYSHRFRRDAGADSGGAVAVGVPIPGVAVRIVDAGNALVAEGETGEVQVRGAPVAAGYLDAQGIDRSSFTTDGWFRTGDLGTVRDGQLTITGRAKDVIIVNGANFSCHEIEAVVETVSGVEVTFTAACAVRHPGDATDRLAVFLVTQLTGDDVRRDLVHTIRATLADRAGVVAQHVVILEREQIPKTAIGKIRRAELRKHFEDGAFAAAEYRLAAAPAWRTPVVFHQRVWHETGRPAPRSLPAGPWLVFADAVGLGEALARTIQSHGGTCILVDPGDAFARRAPDRFVVDPLRPTDTVRLHRALEAEGMPPRHTVHLWAYGPDRLPLVSANITQALARVSYSVLFAAQALARSRAGRVPHHLWVISSRACEVRQGEGAVCERAALGGFVKTLSQECAWLSCTHVDLDGSDGAADLEELHGELAAGGEQPEIAYRDGHRWRVQIGNVESRGDGRSPVVDAGRYLVSGGLGGIGSRVVEDLLRRYRAHVLVIGRSPVDAVADRWRGLRRFGDLAYVAADVADAAAVEAAIRAAEARWGRTLDGVFHLAGTYAERPLLEETPETLAHGLRAKVGGALALHQWLLQRPGTFIVHFSSVLGAFGGALAGVYAAGNAFLAELAHEQRRLGWRSHCLLWSQWEETGMNRAAGLDAALRGKGYRTLTREQGLELLWAALREDRPHLLIGLDEKNVHVRARLETPPEAAAESDSTAIAPRTTIERELARIWREILELEDIRVDDNFFEIGGDSLMAVRVVAEIEATFGKRLPMTAVFRAPTLGQLAAVLDRDAAPPGSCELVPLRTEGTGAAFFCIAGAGEDASVFADLAAALPSGRPFYGLHVLGLDATDPDQPQRSIEEVGAHLVDAMRRMYPQGPYLLGGHCLGGLFAYEVAQQLLAQNEEVAFLALIDTTVSDSRPLHVVAPLRVRLAAHRRQLSRRSAVGKVQYVVRKVVGRDAALRLRRQLHRALAPIEAMHRRYELKPYPGRLTLVFALDSFLDQDPGSDPRRRWERLALDGAEILTVAGDHESLLRLPFVADLAQKLGVRLLPEQRVGRDGAAASQHRASA